MTYTILSALALTVTAVTVTGFLVLAVVCVRGIARWMIRAQLIAPDGYDEPLGRLDHLAGVRREPSAEHLAHMHAIEASYRAQDEWVPDMFGDRLPVIPTPRMEGDR